MLDLNVNIITSADSSCDEKEVILEVEKVVVPQGSKIQMEEDSETSNSSVVNSEEVQTPTNNVRDENPSENSSAFIFDILKSGKDSFVTINTDKVENPSPKFVTRSLFPATGDEESKEVEFGLSLSSRPQRLNLSFADSEGQAAELRLIQQKPLPPQQPVRKSRRGPRSRSSQYRGVTFYRRTGRWESHIWDCGKQVYLGGFDTAHAAARAYDRAAVKFRGIDADINFTVSDYEEDMKQTRNLTKEEFVQTLRRQSNGFSRANSKYRSVTTLQKCGRWEAQTGQFIGNKGIQSNKGVTNFQPRIYQGEIVSNTNNIEGSEDNLDLSLGISMSSNDPKRNYPLFWKACEIPNNVMRPKIVDNSASGGGQIPIVSTMASKYPNTCSGGIYPGFLPKHEENAIEKNVEAVSSPRLLNWSWQVQSNTSHNNVATMPMFSIAASSGFSSSTNYVPPTNLPLNHQKSNFSRNLSFPMSTTFPTDNSYYSYKH